MSSFSWTSEWLSNVCVGQYYENHWKIRMCLRKSFAFSKQYIAVFLLKIICLSSFPSKTKFARMTLSLHCPSIKRSLGKHSVWWKPLCYTFDVCRSHRLIHTGHRHHWQRDTCHALFWLENQLKQHRGPGKWWVANHCPLRQSSNQTSWGVKSKCSRRIHSKLGFPARSVSIWKKT